MKSRERSQREVVAGCSLPITTLTRSCTQSSTNADRAERAAPARFSRSRNEEAVTAAIERHEPLSGAVNSAGYQGSFTSLENYSTARAACSR